MSTTCSVCELHAESTFRIEGMDCHEEVAILHRRLTRLKGLEALDADVVGQRLRVKYDAAALSASAIAEAVAQTGMRAWLETEQPLLPAGASWRQWMVLASGVSLAAGLTLLAFGRLVPAWPLFLLSTITGGVPVARRAFTSARAGVLDINVLMVIAVIGAGVLGEWTEAASVVFLFALAQLLETRAMERARGAIRALMELSPTEATVARNGGTARVSIEAVRVGEIVLVRPGDKIPLDGLVVAGESFVNQAPVTGESLPVDKAPGDEVFAGSINGRGALDIEVTRVRADSTIARIIHLVETAQAQRAPSQTFVERFARIYTPVVLATAALVALIPPLLADGDWTTWVYRSLVLLVISCPCALVISTPVSIVSALAAAARKGVLIKGGARLEQLAAVRCMAFDKTGTLTSGRPAVTQVIPLGHRTSEEILAIAASLEARSEHPIAHAIVARAVALGCGLAPVEDFAAVPGQGAEGTVSGRRILVGNARFLEARRVHWPDGGIPLSLPRNTSTAVFVAADGEALGTIIVADEPRRGARESLELLKGHGIRRIVMLTGDRAATGQALASELAVDEVHADLLPEHKADVVARLRKTHGLLAMVGDGVNDAPALAAADVGIAMGAAGTAAALETADIALMADELPKISYAVRLSRATVRNIRANIAFSLALKGIFLAMAIAGSATLWMAVTADMGASLLVIANALRLLRE